MRTLGLTATDGRRLEARLVSYGDRLASGAVHDAIVPVVEFALAGARARRAFAVVPLEFVREHTGTTMALAAHGGSLQLGREEVARLVSWIEAGAAGAEPEPLVVVCGDELEVGRTVAVLGRMALELVRAERPGVALAALRRDPALLVVAGSAPGLEPVVRAAAEADVPVLAVGDADEPALAAARDVRRVPLDQRQLFAAIGDLLDLV